MVNSNLVLLFSCLAALAVSSHAIGTLSTNRIGSVFLATADIRYLNHGQCAQTETSVDLNNIEWSVRLCKTASQTLGTTLDVALVSNVVGRSATWHCDAQASIKFLGPNNKYMVKSLLKTRFTNEAPVHYIRGFYPWAEFTAQYVADNKTTFEVAMTTSVPNTNEPSDVEVTKARIHVMLDNVSKLSVNLSPEVVLRGIRWRVVTKRLGGGQGNVSGALGVYLEAVERDFGLSSSYKVNATFKLLTHDSRLQPIINTIDEFYYWGVPQRGFDNFLRWEQLFDVNRKFILVDKANILVEFSVEEPTSLGDKQGNINN